MVWNYERDQCTNKENVFFSSDEWPIERASAVKETRVAPARCFSKAVQSNFSEDKRVLKGTKYG